MTQPMPPGPASTAPGTASRPAAGPNLATPGAALVPGQYVGNYRVLRLLGSGGMGAVYQAENPSIHSRVAIKVLHPQRVTDPGAAQRFLDEARAVNIIGHPSIVRTHDLGQLADGAAYIVMELLAGQELGARLSWCGGRLGPVSLLFARQIASALAAAHARGIVHRDLKPENVMIVSDPEMPTGERVKLLDFGIAKLAAEARAPGDHGADAPGLIMGTPRYMSPEQCCGAPVDGKTDVYALGIMLYQLVAGAPPFAAAAIPDLIRMHLSAEPYPLARIDPFIPPGLAALVHAMLAKDPARRPTMAEVAASLSDPAVARARAPLNVAASLRRRKLALWSAIAALLASGATAASLWLAGG
jgi:serine/threonine protein kinase